MVSLGREQLIRVNSKQALCGAPYMGNCSHICFAHGYAPLLTIVFDICVGQILGYA